MFDIGVNLFDKRFDPEAVLLAAYKAGVEGILIISSNLEEAVKAKEFCENFNTCPISLYFTAGVHPHHAKEWNADSKNILMGLIDVPHFAAIGECGLDFNRNFSTPEQQIFAFKEQIELASTHNLGLYLHERDAFDTQVELLTGHAKNTKFKIAHCFTGNQAQLTQYLSLGCYIGVTGWVCDLKRGIDLREAVGSLPLERMLLETDSPYLFPKTLKSKSRINVPENIIHVSQEIAEIIGENADRILSKTKQNAFKLFSAFKD
ncbi:TatD family hydrolase [Glaciecola sp. 1036]|uniref:TatD family hydrolase n=1 Tax=Alteromonadaceae TaxID=72275 RepID=UPI003D05877A